jgi:hypothetical protein
MNLVKSSGRRWISRHYAMAMQKKEKIRGGAAGAAGIATIGLGAAPVTLGLFLLPGGRLGRRLARAADDDPAAAGVVLLLFFSHEGDLDLVVLLENQGSDEYHRRQPWETKEET